MRRITHLIRQREQFGTMPNLFRSVLCFQAHHHHRIQIRPTNLRCTVTMSDIKQLSCMSNAWRFKIELGNRPYLNRHYANGVMHGDLVCLSFIDVDGPPFPYLLASETVSRVTLCSHHLLDIKINICSFVFTE